jgi:site-specific DNA-methyltransferase (adenine-specific)
MIETRLYSTAGACVIGDCPDILLMQGDCLERMKEIESGSVDMVLADPPYGTTACKWDSVIPFEPMWSELKRIIKPNGAIVMTASQPFTTALIYSNMKNFKYCWVWNKSRFSNQMLAKKQPLKIHEDVIVFCCGSAPYNPQGLIEVNKTTKQGSRITDNNGGGIRSTEYLQTHTNYPKSIQQFASEGKTVHPTQKPVTLMEYLIKTYTNTGETVIDFTMGSGTTGVAAINTGRKFIGIELDEKYFNIAKERIEKARQAKEAA